MPITGVARHRMDGSSALGQGTHVSYPNDVTQNPSLTT